jgi:preprotein translocase subunit SecD
MKNKKVMFWAIIALTIACIFTIVLKPAKLGLDLVGGSRLVLEAQTTDTISKITPEMMDSLKFAIENRINAIGVAETLVQQTGERRLLIEIPNVSDPKKAKEFLGETAELEFKRPIEGFNNSQSWVSTGLTGNDLRKALISTNPGNGEWVVSLEFNDKGTKKFAKLTQELVGKPMAIFFNRELQSSPVIQEPIWVVGLRLQAEKEVLNMKMQNKW